MDMKISGSQLAQVGSCSWCDSSHPTSHLPSVFCWTRMQSEAGQGLDLIIRRKELERSIGKGVFYWGIGNSLGTTIAELLRRTSQPEVFFSIMRAKPKRQDVAPATVLLWTEYIDENGRAQPLPPHALVLSRGSTASGVKKRCYALVCYSETVLSPSSHAYLDLSHFRNLGGTKSKIGFSQVTATIEHTTAHHESVHYEISLRSLLTPPFFVTLAGAKKLLDEDREAIQATVASNPTPDKWRAFTKQIRSRSEYGGSSLDSFALSPGQ
jgi:hypothetical protein